MKKILFSFVIVVLLSGCFAVHNGIMTSSAALSAANFSYVKQNIKGKASATYFLGIGGLLKESLIAEAKKDMLEKNPLQSNQALVNLTVSYKTDYQLGIMCVVYCVVTADVVEFK